jgi:phage-related holin
VNQLVGYSPLMMDGFLTLDEPLSTGANKDNKKMLMFYVVYEGISIVF